MLLGPSRHNCSCMVDTWVCPYFGLGVCTMLILEPLGWVEFPFGCGGIVFAFGEEFANPLQALNTHGFQCSKTFS